MGRFDLKEAGSESPSWVLLSVLRDVFFFYRDEDVMAQLVLQVFRLCG